MKETHEDRCVRLASRACGVNPNVLDTNTVSRLLAEGVLSYMNGKVYSTALGLRLAERAEQKQFAKDPRKGRKLSRRFDAIKREEFEYLARIATRKRVLLKDEDVAVARTLYSRRLIGVYDKHDKRDGLVSFQVAINNRGRRALQWRQNAK